MRKNLEHGMLLDAKSVMDNALPDLKDLYEMVPIMLHPNLEAFIRDFKTTLAKCDVASQYTEK